MHFCAKCNNMYYIRIGSAAVADTSGDGTGASQTTQEPNPAQDPDATTLYHYCRNCGHEVKIEKTICVSKLQLKHRAQSYSNVINKYTKLDPTLPRINNIKCPNSLCRSNPSLADAAATIRMKPRPARVSGGLEKWADDDDAEQYEDLGEAAGASNFTFSTRESEPREVIYIRYDEVNMKYVYMCAVCDTVWNTAHSNIL
jgi:hypothetical protein